MNPLVIQAMRNLAAGLALLWALPTAQVASAQEPPLATYQVTIQNLTDGQPFSPPVVATHRSHVSMFREGRFAGPEVEAIAEDGNQIPMVELLNGLGGVTEVVDVGQPLTRAGTTVAGFTDAATFEIQARPGDRLSLTSMLICTNDGFLGLDRAFLPVVGSAVYRVFSYDAGTENNTEMSADIVDPCSALGPVALDGDPNGNENDAVDQSPRRRIQRHPGIAGAGDLSAGEHGWTEPVAKVTVVRLADDARLFQASLSGFGEVPPVDSHAFGAAGFLLFPAENVLAYNLRVFNIKDVVAAHIHVADPNANGPVVSFLFGPSDPAGKKNGKLAAGFITPEDLIGPLAGDFDGFIAALRDGQLYVNVHTAANPGGEIRGQIGAFPIPIVRSASAMTLADSETILDDLLQDAVNTLYLPAIQGP